MAYKNHLHNPHCHFKLLDSNIYTMWYIQWKRPLNSWSHKAPVFYDTFNLKQNNTYEVTAAVAVLGNSSIVISCFPKQHIEFQ